MKIQLRARLMRAKRGLAAQSLQDHTRKEGWFRAMRRSPVMRSWPL